MKPLGNKKLTEAEINELQEFLLSGMTPDKTMDIEALDGFLTAVVIGPDTVMPSEWLRVVWNGSEGPEYESMEQANRILGLIMRHMNSIANTLMNRPDRYEPIILNWEKEEDYWLMGMPWAIGFFKGMDLRRENWKELTADEEYGEMVMPIMTLLARPDDPEYGEIVNSAAKRKRFVDMLPDAVMDIHEFWLERREHFAPAPAIAKERKPGRNEPCPCGSGKKFKKCCGSPGKLH